jgi:O6-methylguanine-DNA--protein-cysteine methyltransferase
MGRRHGLYDIFVWLDSAKTVEFSSDDLLAFIKTKRDEAYKKAFADDDFAALNYEVKKKLDFGKLSSYTAIANHINDRKAKLDPAEE